MSTPSDLLRKANTAQYVLDPSASGMPIKNPAYYMQPPRANASIWMPEPARAPRPWPAQAEAPATQWQSEPKQSGYANARQPNEMWSYIPQQPAAAQQYGGQFQQPMPTHQYGGQYQQPVPTQQCGGQYQQPTPAQQSGGQYQQFHQQAAQQNPQAAQEYRAPTVEKEGMRISVQPPNIPSPVIPQREPTFYRQLMQKHDRAASGNRHVK